MAQTGAVTDKTRFESLREWARSLQRDVVALWLAARDPRVPWFAKVFAAGVAAYALSPIDLIPDFVPFLGYLDDLLIVALGIWAVIKLIPQVLMTEFREQAQQHHTPTSKVGTVIVLCFWLVAVVLTAWFM